MRAGGFFRVVWFLHFAPPNYKGNSVEDVPLLWCFSNFYVSKNVSELRIVGEGTKCRVVGLDSDLFSDSDDGFFPAWDSEWSKMLVKTLTTLGAVMEWMKISARV